MNIMLTICFYNTARKNAKELKRFSFQYDNYTISNYLHAVLSYIVEFKPKYYTINLFKTYKSRTSVYVFRFSTGYRNYQKIYDIESVINTLIAWAFNDMHNVTRELCGAHDSIIIRQLINRYYNN